MSNGQSTVIPPFPTTNGNIVELEEYLKAIHKFAVENTEKNIKWYIQGVGPNKFWARVTRLGAISFVALGGITPLVITALLKDDAVSADFVAQISYIFLGIAAFLIGVDKFFGFSASWMRYITTQIALETLLANFRYDWAIESVKACDKLDTAACNNLLMIAKNLATNVQSKMEIETAEWANDLRNNLIEIEKKSVTSKAEPEPTKENKPPTIVSLTANPASPQSASTEIIWTAEANDPDNDAILYKFFLNDVAVTEWQNKSQWVWKIPPDLAGKSSNIEVRVIDGKHNDRDGFDARESKDFEVNP